MRLGEEGGCSETSEKAADGYLNGSQFQWKRVLKDLKKWVKTVDRYREIFSL